MRLDWLEDLVALLDCGSITAAAKARNVSQPAFSRRIKMAEDALGCTLLDRGQKPARLLPTVAVMAPRLRSAAIEIRQLRVDLRLAASAEARGLVITSQHSLTTTRAAAIAPAAHALAREGAGVAWVPESIARFDLACGFLLDLSGSLPSTLLELIAIRTKRPRSDAHAAAWDRLVNGQALGTS